MHENIKDLTNQRFGRLIVVSLANKRSWGKAIWLCRCDCGNLTEVVGNSLCKGDTRSCGCLKKEMNAKLKPAFKHGDIIYKKPTRLYITWAGMKTRCSNQNAPDYKWYGGKGISICKEWIKNYLAFKFWAILNGYADNLTIDRIDNDGNYEPSNCQWITKSENSKKGHIERRQRNG